MPQSCRLMPCDHGIGPYVQALLIVPEPPRAADPGDVDAQHDLICAPHLIIAGSLRSAHSGSARVIHSFCCPVGGRPASARKSQTKSQRRPTSGDAQRRQATDGPGQVPTERHQATSSDARNVTGGQGVAGSNPAVPTGSQPFSNIFLLRKSQQKSQLVAQRPSLRRAPTGCHGALTGHVPARQSRPRPTVKEPKITKPPHTCTATPPTANQRTPSAPTRGTAPADAGRPKCSSQDCPRHRKRKCRPG